MEEILFTNITLFMLIKINIVFYSIYSQQN